MIEFVKGDFFEFDADIRINTVNCVGVMGAGVALAFKKKYPDMFKEYVQQCKSGQIRPGKPSIWHSGDMLSKGIEVINFPTKNDWKKPSEYEYVESGLRWLANYLSKREGLVVTLPALGCGHGGLNWDKVKTLIEGYLSDSPHKILVFEPLSSKKAGGVNSLSSETLRSLERFGIKTVDKHSAMYPDALRRYTEKDLYYLGNFDLRKGFDVSIISSSKPSEIEKKVIIDLINYCKKNNLFMLFGGTAFDKNVALNLASEGREVGVFLPAGIYISAEKLMKKNRVSGVNLLSIGDPFEDFDKKAYMPSVLSRLFISKLVVFTTERLEWVAKHKKSLINEGIRTFYVNYENLSIESRKSTEETHSIPIEILSGVANFNSLKN